MLKKKPIKISDRDTVLLVQSNVTGNPCSNMEAPNTESSETEIFLGTQNSP